MPLAGAAASMRDRPRAWLAPADVGSAQSQAAGDCCPLRGRKVQPGAKSAACNGGRSCRGSARARRHRPPEGSNACRRDGCPRRRRAAPPPMQGSGDGATRVREEGYGILLRKG
ncbi:hypothetical protein GW17_00014740 [Ensete ventricosum]|nr:hypothetical protein GW17_00014740 [Ensete ventricosum]